MWNKFKVFLSITINLDSVNIFTTVHTNGALLLVWNWLEVDHSLKECTSIIIWSKCWQSVYEQQFSNYGLIYTTRKDLSLSPVMKNFIVNWIEANSIAETHRWHLHTLALPESCSNIATPCKLSKTFNPVNNEREKTKD